MKRNNYLRLFKCYAIFISCLCINFNPLFGQNPCGVYKRNFTPQIDSANGAIPYYDNFGNLYSSDEFKLSSNNLGSRAACSSGHFDLTFSNDIIDIEQTAICAAFLNLSGKITNVFGRRVKIRVEKEDLAQNVFAVGSSLYATSLRCKTGQIINNSVWKKLNTNSTYVAEEYDGYLKLNKKTNVTDWFPYDINNTNPPANQVDLFTVALHEGMHILGMHSLMSNNGNPNPSYSAWDRYLFVPSTSINDNLIKPAISNTCCQFEPNTNVTFPITGNCQLIVENSPKLEVNTMFQTDLAHSISHLCKTDKLMALNYTGKGIARRLISSDEQEILCKIGYKLATAACTVNNCIVQAVDDYFTIPDNQSSLTINIAELLDNDLTINNTIVVRNSSNQQLAITNNKVTLTGFNVFGRTLFNYTITSCNGICSEGIIYVYKTMAMPPCPADCNLVCNGNLDAFTIGNGTSNINAQQFFGNMLIDDSNTPDYFTGFDSKKIRITPSIHCNNIFKFNDPANLNLVDYQVVSNPYSPTNGFIYIIAAPSSSSHEAFYLPFKKDLKIGKKYKIDFDAFSSCPGSLRFAFSEKPPCPYPIRHKDVLLGATTTGNPPIDCQNGDYFYPPQIRDFVVSHNPNIWTHHNDIFVADKAAKYLIVYNTTNTAYNGTFLDNISVLSEEDNPILIDNSPVSLCIGSVAKVKIKFCNPTNETITINAETTLDISKGYTYAAGDFTTTNTNGKATISLTIPPTSNGLCVEKTLNFNIPANVTSGMTTKILVNLFGDNVNCLKNKFYQFDLTFNNQAPTTADFAENAVAPCPAMQLIANDQTNGTSHTWTIKQTGTSTITTLGTTPTIDLSNLLANTSYEVTHTISNQCGSLQLTKTIQSPTCPTDLECACDNDIHHIGKVDSEQKLSQTNFFIQHPIAFDEPTCMTIAGRLIIDVPYTFQNVEMIMQPGSEIVVSIPNSNPTNSFNILNCNLHSCNRMWRGIKVQAKNFIYTDDITIIEDAEYGIRMGNNVDGRIRKTIFDKCYVGIYMDTGGWKFGDPISIGTTIENNIFSCDNPLLLRYDNVNLGSITYAGIQINRQAAAIGIYVDPTTQNDFFGLRNAVLSRWGVVDINHIRVHDLTGAFPQTLIVNPTRIDNFGVRADFSRVKINYSNFANLDRGVHLTNNINYFQANTTINSLVTGLGNVNSKGSFNVPNENTFISERHGIKNFNSPNANFNVGYAISSLTNLFQNTANSTDLWSAIDIEAFTAGSSGTIIKRIESNDILISTDYNGINILRDGGYRLKNNAIVYSFNTLGISNGGIVLSNSNRNRLSLNGIDATTGSLPYFGFQTQQSSDNLFCCNTVDKTTIGFDFTGACMGTQMRTNSILNTPDVGLLLRNGTMIGIQENHWNDWAGNFTNGHIAARSNPAFQPITTTFTAIQRRAMVRASQFTVPNPQGTNFFPTAVEENNLDEWFKGVDNTDVKVCENEPVCGSEILNFKSTQLDGIAPMLAENAFAGATFGANLQWKGAKWALERVKEQPAWLGQNPAFDNYYYQIYNTNIRRFSDIDALIAEFDLPTTEQAAALALIDSNDQTYSDELRGWEPVVLSDPSNMAVRTRRQVLLGLRYAGLEQQLSIQEDIDGVKAQKVTIAVAMNDAITTDNLFEQNEQVINRIYFQTLAIGNEELTEAQKSIVTAMANQCPLIHGDAVFKARVLFSLYSHVRFNDRTLCTITNPPGGEPASKMSSSIKDKTFIYPNPTSDVLNINVPNSLPAKLIIKDISGRILESVEFEGQYTLNTANYFNGMIFCEVWQDNQRTTIERVIINH